MQVKVVERAFTPKGRMKAATAAERRETKGYLPFYSVDTREEVDALIELAVAEGEFVRGWDPQAGREVIVEATLMKEQTLDNLRLAGQRMAALHERLSEGSPHDG